MQRIIIISLFILTHFALLAQIAPGEEGTVSYITSQNVYVKFNSTENISVGDTLYVSQEGTLRPVLVVENLSSISCVCTSISDIDLSVSSIVLTRQKRIAPDSGMEPEIVPVLPVVPVEEALDSAGAGPIISKPEQQISGRFGISSYTNFSNTEGSNSQKMRYTASFNMRNISGTPLSVESYISFVYNNQRWDEVKDNIFNGLKIYNLSLNYDFNETTRLLLGRKINPRLSSMGAIDGLQFEKKFGSISLGLVAGSRPDYRDYSVNLDLFQAGAYLSHEYVKGRKMMQSSVAFIQQMNDWKTDRRFIYLQHTNSLVKDLFFIGTVELDLYKKIQDVQSNTFRLSNLYLSLRYRVIRQLSFTLSYNTRQNIIYYETYKNIIEQYLDDETWQGYRFQVNASPFKNFSLGATIAYRFSQQDPRPTKNLYAYATYSRLPFIQAATTASFTWLETGYLSGKIYSIGLSKDLVPGKLSGGISYRYVDYNFISDITPVAQNMAEANLVWRIMKKLSLSVYYEGTFEKVNTYNRIYINVTQRL